MRLLSTQVSAPDSYASRLELENYTLGRWGGESWCWTAIYANTSSRRVMSHKISISNILYLYSLSLFIGGGTKGGGIQ
jgi:hypothetical protein